MTGHAEPSEDGADLGPDAEAAETSLERLRATLGSGSGFFFSGVPPTVVPSVAAAVTVTRVPASSAAEAARVISGGPSRAPETTTDGPVVPTVEPEPPAPGPRPDVVPEPPESKAVPVPPRDHGPVPVLAPEPVPEHMPVLQPEPLLERVPDRPADNLPDRPADQLPDRSADHLPDRSAEQVPDPVPDRGPAVPPSPSVVRVSDLYASETAEAGVHEVPPYPGAAGGPTTALPRQAPARTLEQPEWQPAGARATGRVQPLATTPFRTKLHVRRVDPFSVLKTALVLGICFFIAGMVAVYTFYEVLDKAGVFDSLDSALDGFDTNRTIRDALEPGAFLPVAAIVVGAMSVLGVAASVLGAMLYNVAATFGGGIRVTLAEPKRRRQ